MNAQRLYLQDGTPTQVWFCGTCHVVVPTQSLAEKCCQPCACGKTAIGGTKRRRECSAENFRRIAAERDAKRLALAETVEDRNGPVFWEGTGNDGFHESTDDLLEWLEDNGVPRPEYVFAVKVAPFPGLDLDRLLEMMAEELYEDAIEQFCGVPALSQAIDTFNEDNDHLGVITPDYTRKVRLPTKEAP